MARIHRVVHKEGVRMKKRGIAGLITIALLVMLILPGCVSMDQINALEQEVSSLQNELSAVSNRNQEMESEIQVYVTKQEFTTELKNFITKVEMDNFQELRDGLLNGLSTELQKARGELEVLAGNMAKDSDLQVLSNRVSSLEEDFSQVNFVISELMIYGGYSSAAEMIEFVYGLVDLYDTLNSVEIKLQKLKEAMTLFVQD